MKFSVCTIAAFAATAVTASAISISPNQDAVISGSQKSENESVDRSSESSINKHQSVGPDGRVQSSEQSKASGHYKDSKNSEESEFEQKYVDGRLVNASSSSKSSAVSVENYHSESKNKTVVGEYIDLGNKAVTVIDLECDAECQAKKQERWGTYVTNVNKNDVTLAICVENCSPELQVAAPVCVYNCAEQTVYTPADSTHGYFHQVERVLGVLEDSGKPQEKYVELYKNVVIAEKQAPSTVQVNAENVQAPAKQEKPAPAQAAPSILSVPGQNKNQTAFLNGGSNLKLSLTTVFGASFVLYSFL